MILSERFAIPGLMTPQAVSINETAADGLFAVQVPIWSEAKDAADHPAGMKLLSQECTGKYRVLMSDPSGRTIFRENTVGTKEYKWRFNPGDLVDLKNGDYTLLFTAPGKEVKHMLKFRRWRFVDDFLSQAAVTPTVDILGKGSFSIPADTSVIVVPYGQTFTVTPTQIFISFIAPSDGEIQILTGNVLSIGRESMIVGLSPAAPTGGYTLVWEANRTIIQTANEQWANLTLTEGQQVVEVTYPSEFTSVPTNLKGTIYAPIGDEVVRLTFVTSAPTTTGFTLYLNQPVPTAGYVFAWRAKL